MGKIGLCAALCVIGILIQIAFIVVEAKKKYVPAVCLKGTAALVFVFNGICAGWAVLGSGAGLSRYILIGLILGAAGDIFLNLRFCFKKGSQAVFFAGIAAFLAGHIFYILFAGKQISGSGVLYLIIGIVLAAVILFFVFTKLKDIKIGFKVFGGVYIGVVSVMAAYAMGCLIGSVTVPHVLFAIGAVLFLVSDIVMVFNTFGKTQRTSLRATNLLLYYLGQLLIGITLYFVA